jgi:hypothetical protein
MESLRRPGNALHWKAMARLHVDAKAIPAFKAAFLSRPRQR